MLFTSGYRIHVGDHGWANERFADLDLRARNRFSLTIPAGNRFSIAGHSYFNTVGEQFLGRFERDMDGWRLEGEAITNHGQHTFSRGQLPLFGHVGSAF